MNFKLILKNAFRYMSAAILIVAVGLVVSPPRIEATAKRKICVAGYSVPGEAVMQGIAPAFARKWATEHGGEVVEFEYSWTGSSAQARNVIAGNGADVIYLSDWSDVEQIVKAGLITQDWYAGGQGIVSQSVVVLRVPTGNPANVKLWMDVTRPGVKIVTPNPRTSGGARWNILALYGAVLKSGGNAAAAEEALRAFYRNVVVFDENARASTQSFERGVADVSITYENELLLRRRQGKQVDFVIPPSTIIIENPAAVVDVNSAKHGVSDIAAAFVKYLRDPVSQKVLAEFGLRPADPAVHQKYSMRFPTSPGQFDLAYLGGGPKIYREIFEKGGLWDRIVRSERRANR